MSELSDLTTELLEQELDRRKIAKSLPVPVPLETMDFTALIETITDGTAQSIKDGYENDDLDHYIYEAAVEAVYGKSYWAWRRAQKW